MVFEVQITVQPKAQIFVGIDKLNGDAIKGAMERQEDADLGAKSIALVFLLFNSSFESISACCSVIKISF